MLNNTARVKKCLLDGQNFHVVFNSYIIDRYSVNNLLGGFSVQVTLLVGNGFDIQAGLKTSYSEFYDYLREKSLEDKSLRQNAIFTEINKDENLWSNFEIALMELTKRCDLHDESALTVDKLAKDKDEIEDYLGEYLSNVNKEYNVEHYSKDIIKEFKRSFSVLISILPLQRQGEISEILNLQSNTSTIWVNIIDFNYTSLFKDAFELLPNNSPIAEIKELTNSNRKLQVKKRIGGYVKLHGDTKANMNLGGHDSQISESVRESEYRFFFDKEALEHENGTNKYKTAKEFINATNLYFVLGMSLGETDKVWWERIADIVSNNTQRALVILEYDSNESINNKPYLRQPSINRVKDRFLNYATELSDTQIESVSERIFVQYNSKLFNLGSVGTIVEEK